MTAFIYANKGPVRVEPICAVLTEHGVKTAPSTYCAATSHPPSAPGGS